MVYKPMFTTHMLHYYSGYTGWRIESTAQANSGKWIKLPDVYKLVWCVAISIPTLHPVPLYVHMLIIWQIIFP